MLARPAGLADAKAWTIVASGVLGIGVADYLSGIRISLALFYLIPIVVSAAWFGRTAGILVALVCVLVRITGDSLLVGIDALPFSTWWNSLSAAIVFSVIVWLFSSLLALYRQMEHRVTERTAALVKAAEAQQRLEHELLLVGARERNAFGQELHDDICQHLVGTAMAAQVLARRLADHDSAAANDAMTIVHWVEEGASKARRLARGLLMSSLEPSTLVERLQDLSQEATQQGVVCRVRQDGETLLPDPESAAQVFRIAQEAMRNALKHARPHRIGISLQGDENAICLIVEDDGHGELLPQDQVAGMGLRIMSHRAAVIGGTLSVVPTKGVGTRVILHLPRNHEP